MATLGMISPGMFNCTQQKFSGTTDLLHKLEIFSLALEGYLEKDSLGRMDQTLMCWAYMSFQWPLGYCCSGVSAQGPRIGAGGGMVCCNHTL